MLHQRWESFSIAHRLSERERQVLLFVLQGVPLKLIGDDIGCEYASVRTYLRRMCKKVGCSGSRELVVRVLQHEAEVAGVGRSASE